MKFVRVKDNGEKLYREATERADVAAYKNNPRWQEISDEEYDKAMNPAAVEEAPAPVEEAAPVEVPEPVVEEAPAEELPAEENDPELAED